MIQLAETKLCGKCREPFVPRPAKGPYRCWCAPCVRQYAVEYRLRNHARIRAREKVRAADPIRVARVAQHSRRSRLEQAFGITPERYDELLAAQGGVCAICRKPETCVASMKRRTGERVIRRLAVDHDHDTGRIRGLLCARCNVAVGRIGDDPEVARRMADYLEPAPSPRLIGL